MSFKHRLKLACVNFIRELAGNAPYATPREIIRYVDKETEPGLVFDNQFLAGKNVLITGAGRNIGRAIAHEMARQGANIYFTDIDQEHCAGLKSELQQYSVNVTEFQGDISNTETTDALLQTLVEAKVTIDVLVNNVGIGDTSEKGIQYLNLDAWRKIFETNVFGPMYLTKQITQMMMDSNTQGNVIFITSIHQNVVFGWPSYSASKAALGLVIKELALDLAAHRIRVNGIAPGWVAEDEQGHPHAHQYTPLHNCSVKPAYIGRTAVYLTADYFSGMTTGAVVTVDGGLSLHSYLSTL